MSVRRHVIVLLLTVAVIVGTFVATLLSDQRPVLGLDLQGGISVIKFPEDGQDLSTLDVAVEIIRDRVEAAVGATSEPEVTRQGDTVVIDLPGVEDRDRALELANQTGKLRFRPVLTIVPFNFVVPETTTTEPGATTTTAAVEGAEGAGGADTTTTSPPPTTSAGDDADASARRVDTRPIAAVRPAQETATTVPEPGTTTTAPPAAPPPTAPPLEPGDSCEQLLTPRAEQQPDAQVVLPDRDRELCYVLGPAEAEGDIVDSAGAEYAPAEGWGVTVTFTSEGSTRFDQLAAQYVGRQVAIELDGVVQSAPTIQQASFGGSAVISGEFSESEAKHLERLLRYGALPIEFNPDEETVQSISPSLGKDQLRAGIVAGVIGLALVALYMVLYYRLLGLVVWIGLGLTALVFFTLVSYLSARQGLTLTLAGVTGLIVSVGVTVDSYVLYFERMKDEIRTGKTVRSSLDVAFKRAFRTIVAADIVALLGAVVLYLLAAGSVRGFAFFLGVSTVIDLALAYFYMQPLVSLLARRPELLRMKGVGIAAGLDAPGVRA